MERQLAPGFYTVTVSDNNDCTIIQEIEVEQIVSTDEAVQNIGFKLFPNPAKDRVWVTFEIPERKEWELLVYNALGQIVFSYTDDFSSHLDQKILIEDLQKGIYSVSLIFDNKIISETATVF